ncbi:MAG: outer membrane lipoprotein carrier protein LolA [Nitrospira sp.]|nr:outer membrane lipoprotein carrier protein LolA [Nitrospira sp.]
MNRNFKKFKSSLLLCTGFLFSLLGFYFSLCTVSCAVLSVDEDITRIQNAYDDIKDIKGSFTQKSHIKDLKRIDTYGGEFFIKRPTKMKWEYKGKTPQEVIISNDEIIIYQRKERQAFKGSFDRATYGQAPIALLSGFGRIQEEFNVSKKNGRLLLKPKKSMGNIVSIEIETSEDEFPIKSFIVNDSRSNRIEITLKDVEINTGLEDRLFVPSLPKDVNVYEHNP